MSRNAGVAREMRAVRSATNILTVLAGLLAFAAPAGAQTRAMTIPPGPLGAALDSFVRQSGNQVIFRSEDVRNIRTRGAKGNLSADAALADLLAGTGLVARRDPTGAIAIVRPTGDTVPGASDGQSPEPAIVVTGSRLGRRPIRSIAPIVAIDGEELFRTGNATIGETLDELPALRSTLTQSNSTQIDTGAALNMLDLRGLGINRTLVLENGRRHVSGASFASAVDINAISKDLIDRIDIVTGGSSAIYGSDAVAGVVNFVLKRKFDGLQLRAQRGLSSRGDAGHMLLSGLAGTSFASNRGSVIANVEYEHGDDWYASDRDRYRRAARYVMVDFDPPGLANGSDGVPDTVLVRDPRSFSVSNGGTFIGPGMDSDGLRIPFLFQSDGSLIKQTGPRVGIPPLVPFDGGNGSNLRVGRLFAIYPDFKRLSFNLLGHFTISKAFEPFVEAKFVTLRSLGSSFGSFFSVGAWGPREYYQTDNPFLSDQARTLIRSQLKLPDGEESRFFFRRNFADFGPVAQHNRRETLRGVAGIRGELGSNWSYEVSANHGRVDARTSFTANVNVQRFLLAIDAVRDPATGAIVCRSQIDASAAVPFELAADASFAAAALARDVAECIPLNPFGEGNVSPAAKAYIFSDTGSRSRNTQSVINGFVTGDSSKWFSLPGGPVGIALGAEYRRETVRDVEEELLQAGLTHATALQPFRPPAFSVRELFGEVSLPVLKDRKFVEELKLSAAGRLANYRGSTGTVFAWNGGASWTPGWGVRLRANRSRAIRAPNLVELYQPLGQTFSTTIVRDPCSRESIGRGSPTRHANCLAAGVPDGSSFVLAASFGYLSGGNPDLKAEKSDSLTLGAVIEPRSVPGLSLSADYYDIKVRDVIASPTVQSILDACYDAPSLDNAYCSLFARNLGSSPGPEGEEPGQILHNSLHVVPLNHAQLRVRGIDFAAAYRRKLEALGELDSRLLYTLALQNDSFLTPEDPGRKNQNLLELGNPRHALKWTVGLKRGHLRLEYQLRYFSKMAIGSIEDVRSVQGNPPRDADAFPKPFFPGAAYHGANAEFDAGAHLRLYFGVDNITDKMPPPTVTGVADEGGIYDNVGRYFYAGAVARF